MSLREEKGGEGGLVLKLNELTGFHGFLFIYLRLFISFFLLK